MTDIVWLLRNDVPCNGDIDCAGELCNQAADEIERLRNVLENAQQARVLQGKAIIDAANEIERLRAALHPFAEAAGKFDPDEGDGSQHVWGWSPTIGMLRKARAALETREAGVSSEVKHD